MLHQPLTRNILYQGSHLKPNWLAKNVKKKLTAISASATAIEESWPTQERRRPSWEKLTLEVKENFSCHQHNIIPSDNTPWFPNLIKLNFCSSCPRLKNDCVTPKHQVKLFISTTQSRKPTISYFYQPMNPAAARGWIAKLRHQLTKRHPRQTIWNMFFSEGRQKTSPIGDSQFPRLGIPEFWQLVRNVTR